jgi:hypothetical protein
MSKNTNVKIFLATDDPDYINPIVNKYGDIVKYTETDSIPESPLTFTVVDQLQFIMPKSSLRKARKFVKYPDELHSETRNPWMKRHDWEMKPRISLPWNPATSLTKIVPL